MKAMLPINVTRVKSLTPCESCGVKKVRYKAELNPPGRARVTHRLCDNCIEGIKQ